jgi:hypothetical protein
MLLESDRMSLPMIVLFPCGLRQRAGAKGLSSFVHELPMFCENWPQGHGKVILD